VRVNLTLIPLNNQVCRRTIWNCSVYVHRFCLLFNNLRFASYPRAARPPMHCASSQIFFSDDCGAGCGADILSLAAEVLSSGLCSVGLAG
jgi:hypothetical protein